MNFKLPVIFLSTFLFSSLSYTTNITLAQSETVKDVLPLLEQQLIQAYSQAGHNLTITLLPPTRSLIMSNNGDIDGEVLRIINITEQAPNLLPVNVPISFLDIYVWGKASLDYSETDDFVHLYMVAINGVQFQKNFAEKYNIKTIYVKSLDSSVKMIGSGRADFIVFPNQIIAIAYNNNITDFINHGDPIVKVPLMNFLHKKHKELIPQIEIELKKVLDNQ
ncbi:MAG: hypothetical protein HRU38_20895 [Saccharospirillaceae bacterium]|nr:hypothetical protein [Saccharospirillaceae bacterium]